ncbi:MAG: hypothetical protein IT447_13015 [Phycisphaerales bacterium]|nr:hypothetical protein [Phycisphaerales bacterium]
MKNLIATAFITAFMSFAYTSDAMGQISRGRQILLDRGLQIQAMVFFNQPGVDNPDLDLFQSANFTTINLWEAQNPTLPSQLPANLPWGRQYIPGTNAPSTYLFTEELPYVPRLVSLQYADEIADFPKWRLDDIAQAYQYWKTNYPNMLSYTNFGGATGMISGAELTNYMNVTKPDMLSFDVYPHRHGTPLSDWYKAMQVYRVASLGGFEISPGVNSGPLPYAQYLYTGRDTMDSPLHTPSFIRLQQNASWAFGYTFVNNYVYNAYNEANPSAMFDGMGDASPTPVFDSVKETNRQSLNLGPALVRLQSTDVRFVMGRHPNNNAFDSNGDLNALPDGLTSASSANGWGNSYLTNVAVTNIGDINQQNYWRGDQSLPGDVLLGFFRVLDESFDGPASDETYFMVVNGLVEVEDAPVGDTRQRITLSFNFADSGITSLQRLSRLTGLVETVPLVYDGGSLYHLDLTLDGGEGDLFKFNTGTTFVPEPSIGAIMVMGLTLLRRRKQQ